MFCWPLQTHSSLIPTMLYGPGAGVDGVRMLRWPLLSVGFPQNEESELWVLIIESVGRLHPSHSLSGPLRRALSGFRQLLPSPLLALEHCAVPCGFLTPCSLLFNTVSVWSILQITLLGLLNLFGGLKLNEIMYVKHKAVVCLLLFFAYRKSLINRTLSYFLR